jgi:hypothetical protein
MHGTVTNRVEAYPQGALDKFSDETPKQQALHHEIDLDAKRNRRNRRAGPKTYVRPHDLERVFRDRYGATLPDDDAGRDDLFIMANHLAHFDAPDKRIASWVRRWAPWHGEEETAALIEAVLVRPMKWTADKLGQRLRFTDADRDRLGITTIGGFDCLKDKREARRRKLNNAAKRLNRAEAGAAPHATSAEQTKPWLALGISRRTYYRNRANGTVGTDSSAPYPKDIVVVDETVPRATAAPPRGVVDGVFPPPSKSGIMARALVERASAILRTHCVAPRMSQTFLLNAPCYLYSAPSRGAAAWGP